MKSALLWLCAASMLDAQSILTTFAGADWVFPGDGKPALNAPLGRISGIAVDALGNPVISIADDCLVARIQSNGILSVIAGTGLCFTSGDGGPSASASMVPAGGLSADAQGNLYIAYSSQVRKLTSSGTIVQFAGSSGGRNGFAGD